jgi:predicted GNAT family N-acyltransferase
MTDLDVRELEPEDAVELTTLYEEYKWWADRDQEAVRQALADTDLPLGVETNGDLVAAARVLTDYRYYAVIFDVIVAADRRGDGIGERLMNAIIDHPALQELPGLSLQCRRGLIPFYESLGFEEFDEPVEFPEGGEEKLCRMVYRYDWENDTEPD